MVIPVRCFTCGKPIAHFFRDFKERTAAGEDEKAVLDDLGVSRFCCRRMLITHVDLIEDIIQFGSVGRAS
ncbi:MAG: DNA-directed RNA polymerase subunit N [Candidatus Thorarchaeota archaeon]